MAGRFLASAQPPPELAAFGAVQRFVASRRDIFFSLLVLAACIGLMFTNSLFALCASACGASVTAAVARKGSVSALLRPITGFWALFVFIALVNIFFSYGTRVDGIPFVTHEGARLTTDQWLRLWTWLQASVILARFNFHAVMLQTLRRIFRRHHETLLAGVLALEYFPAVAESSRLLVRNAFASVWHRKKSVDPGDPGLPVTRRWAEAFYNLVLAHMQHDDWGSNQIVEDGFKPSSTIDVTN
jgi:hypothetical protein